MLYLEHLFQERLLKFQILLSPQDAVTDGLISKDLNIVSQKHPIVKLIIGRIGHQCDAHFIDPRVGIEHLLENTACAAKLVN